MAEVAATPHPRPGLDAIPRAESGIEMLAESAPFADDRAVPFEPDTMRQQP